MLIKAIGEAIPIYYLACFKLPETLLEDLHKIMMQFWWGQRDQERKMVGISWNKMCRNKNEGGLVLKYLRAMNLALLAKQYWMLALESSSLFYKVFKGKYFRFGDILSAELGSNPS